MGLRSRGTRAALAALCALAACAAPAHGRDDTVTSFDGTKIVLSFFPAEGLAPGARAPTILVGHGWSQSRETNPSAEGSELFGQVGPGPLRKAGYNVLTWDARGFGRSGGTVQVDSPDFEARDVQALIDWVARQPEARLDRAGDPRVGMSGASYGGGIQFVTAARDPRVDAIVPDIAWNSLLTALFKDGALKAGWGTVLFGAGNAGGLAPGLVGGETGSLDPRIGSAYTAGLTTGAVSDEDRAWFAARGPRHLLDRVRVPTFIVQGTADTLFTLQEAIDNHRALERNGVPLKMMWFCGGHGTCLTGQGEAGRLRRAVIAWFDRWLKGNASVDTGPRFEWLADDARWRTAGGWPLPAKEPLVGEGSGTLALAQTTDSGQPQIAATPAANAVNVPVTGPGAGGAHVLGAPRLEITYSGTGASTAPQDHVYAQIVNPRTGQVVGNQATPIPVELDGGTHTLSRPLEPIASAAPAGGGYVLQLVAYTGLYGPQRATGRIAFDRVRVELPTVDERAAARDAKRGPQLRIGSLWRVAKGRRRVRVALWSSEPLRGVVVRMRDRRGRVLGRSARARVTGRRKVTVRLKRRLRPGRYTLTASGRTVDGADAVRARRSASVRRRR
jgi:ABC-2 type transport system ATP-binding protein